MCALKNMGMRFRKQSIRTSCSLLWKSRIQSLCVFVYVRIGELTSLGLGVGLDLQDHRGYCVCVHVVERVGQPLEPENTLHWDTS